MGRADRFPRAPNRFASAVVIGAAAIVCVHALGTYRTLTHHETLVAQTAREMLESGDWLTPRCFGEIRLQKPPLAYWAAATAASALGRVDELAVRLAFAAAGVALVAVVAILGAGMFGPKSGVRAAFVLLTSYWFLNHARLAEADVLLALFVTISIGAYARMATRPASAGRRAPAIFWISLALACLAKGPVGPALAAAAIAADAAFSGERRAIKELGRARAGIFAFLAIALAWPITLAMTEPAAVRVWFAETVGRFGRDPNDVERFPLYYPLAALWLTLPWTPAWIGELAIRARTGTFGRQSRLLLAWLVGPMLFLSASAGKQEHYLIPALAPCALFAGAGLARWERRWNARLAGVRGWNARIAAFRGWNARLAAFGGVPRGRSIVVIAAASVVVAIVLLQSFVLPKLHGARREADWIAATSRTFDGGEAVIALGHSVRRFAFYCQRPTRRMDSLEEFFATNLGSERWVLTAASTADELERRGRVIRRLDAASEFGSRREHDAPAAGPRAPVFLRVSPGTNVTVIGDRAENAAALSTNGADSQANFGPLPPR